MKVPRHIPQRLCRGYSKSTFSFVPNNEKYVFENEKLSPEQNDAAIPPKPIINSSIKYHHDMKNPEDVADVFTRISFNDFMVSAMSRGATLFGDSKHKFVIKGDESQSVSLHFANMTKSWVEIFNSQISQLSDISTKNDDLHLSSNMEQIKKKYVEIFDIDQLDQFYKALGASVGNGSIDVLQSRGTRTVSFETASAFLIKEVKMEELNVLLTYIEAKLESCSLQGSSEILKSLIERFRCSNGGASHGYLVSSFYDNAVSLFPPISSSLNARQLDDLACLLSAHGSIQQAKKILVSLIHEHKVCPSVDTLDSYVTQLKTETVSNEELVVELSTLKSSFFHTAISFRVFPVLLDVVRDRHDLDQLIRLARSKSEDVLKQFHFEIIAKAVDLQKGSKGLDKEIELTQLVRLLTNADVQIGAKAIGLLQKEFTNQANRESLESLN